MIAGVPASTQAGWKRYDVAVALHLTKSYKECRQDLKGDIEVVGKSYPAGSSAHGRVRSGDTVHSPSSQDLTLLASKGLTWHIMAREARRQLVLPVP